MALQEPSPSGAAGIINALANLVRLLLDRYGPNKTFLLIAGVTLVAAGWRIYSERRKDKKANAALDEKERTIRRLSREVRFYKAALFKEKFGWSDEQLKLLLMGNEPDELESNNMKPQGLMARIKGLIGTKNE
jgi:hypothetical protein